jgi:hypothetical protein
MLPLEISSPNYQRDLLRPRHGLAKAAKDQDAKKKDKRKGKKASP